MIYVPYLGVPGSLPPGPSALTAYQATHYTCTVVVLLGILVRQDQWGTPALAPETPTPQE